MAAPRKLDARTLYTLVVDVRHGGQLYEAGLQFLGDDELVKSRPEIFSEFNLGHRAVVAARQALERVEQQEEARRRAAAAPPAPPAKPQRVVSTRRLLNPGVGQVEPGTVLRASDQLVAANPAAFTTIED